MAKQPFPQYDEPMLRIRCVKGRFTAVGPTTFTRGSRLHGDAGEWIDWTWDGSRLLARTDLAGARPLFWARLPDGFGVATSPIPLLRAGADSSLDNDAVAVFLRTGYFIDTDTPFRGVRILAPNGRVTWSAETGDVVTSGESPLPAMSEARPADEDWCRAAATAVTGAVEARLPPSGRVLLPLSGGRDSRHLLLALCELGRLPDACYTLAAPPPPIGKSLEDRDVALLLGDRYGVPVKVLEPLRRIASERGKNRLTGYLSDEGGWLMPLYAALRRDGRPDDLVFDGGAGGPTFAATGLGPDRQAHLAQGDWSQLAAHLMTVPESWLQDVCTEEALRVFDRGVAHQRLTTELERFANTPNPVSSFMLFNRTRRELLLPSLLGLPTLAGSSAAGVALPFLDPAVRHLGLCIPWQEAASRHHGRILSLAYPEADQVPYARDEAPRPPLSGDASYLRQMTRDLSRLAIGSMLRPLPVRLVKALPLAIRTRRAGADTAAIRSLGDIAMLTMLLDVQAAQIRLFDDVELAPARQEEAA